MTKEVVSAKIMLELKDWHFYLLETEKITRKCGNNSTISLSKLIELTGDEDQPYSFETLGAAIIQKCKELKKNNEEPVRIASKESMSRSSTA